MKVVSVDVDKRLKIELNKSINKGDQKGIMNFGEKNDYPQIIEQLVLGSVTAKSVRDIYAKFLIGEGFEDESQNLKVIGVDQRGKNVTMYDLLVRCCNDASMNNGFYIHCNRKLNGEVTTSRNVPFKNCRFANTDTQGYTAKIAHSDKWNERDFKSKNVAWYPIWTNNEQSLIESVKGYGTIEAYPGQIYFHFLDNQFLYPLSPFDPVYLDCQTESEIGIFKNNSLRNGLLPKTVMSFAEPPTQEDADKLNKSIKNWLGADGDTFLTVTADINPETGQIDKSTAFAIDKIETNINDKLFEAWGAELTNNIRKAAKACPQILIEYENSKLGSTSGEAIIQAVNFYNSMTKSDRKGIEQAFKEIYELDFKIKEISLIQNNGTTNIQPTTGN